MHSGIFYARFWTLCFPCMLQYCHTNHLVSNGSAPSAGECTMKTRICRMLKKLPTSEVSAWSKSSSVTITARNTCSFWRVKVKQHIGHHVSLKVHENLFLKMLFIQCVADFSYEYVQREALRTPLIFKDKDGLGIR